MSLRGDVVALRAPRRASGHEQRERRYAVIVQAGGAAALSTVVVAPTSTRALAAVFRPEVRIAGKQTRVLVDHLTAVDRTCLGRTAGRLAPPELADVDEAIKDLLGLV